MKKGNVELIQTILKKNPKAVKQKNGWRQTALHYVACYSGKGGWRHEIDTAQYYHKYMEILLKAGADPNCKDKWGNTPLHYTVSIKDYIGSRILFNAGARRDTKNDKGHDVRTNYVIRNNSKSSVERIKGMSKEENVAFEKACQKIEKLLDM